MERRLNKVLITGVTGCLGGHLAHQLCMDGIFVRGLGRNADKGKILRDRLGIEFVRADLADENAMIAACAGMDTVFHCGALSSPWGRKRDFIHANADGTRNVIAGCLRNGVQRLVHVSTPSLYFRHGGGGLICEEAPLPVPVNEYVRTKRMAEELVQSAFAQGLETVILRPRAIIGAGDSSILSRLIKALEKKRLPVIGPGDNLTDLTCVENVVRALISAARTSSERVAGKIYNITNGEPVMLWPILQKLAEELSLPQPDKRISRPLAMKLARILEMAGGITGREPALTRYAVGVLSQTQTLNISAARRDLGYSPEVSVEEGLRRFVSWWKAGAGYPFFRQA